MLKIGVSHVPRRATLFQLSNYNGEDTNTAGATHGAHQERLDILFVPWVAP